MALAQSPSFSIVIVTFGQREVTERCLESLDAAFGERLGDDIELVLVDNASPDDTPALLRRWADRATVLLMEKNRNFAGGVNTGVRAASADVVVLLNNDTEVPAGVLDDLVAQALEPGVGIAGCRLLYPNGTIQHGGCAWFRGGDGMVRPFHLFRHEAGDLPAACTTFDCDFVTAACIALRRDLFLELGALDEGFVNGWEDVDLSIRVRLAGHRVVYRGDLAVIHAEGASRSRRPDEFANERRFSSRYAGLIDEDSERLASQFDGVGPDFIPALHPASTPEGTGVSVEGEVTGLSPESAEARALLAALEELGVEPATRSWGPSFVKPRLMEPEWASLRRGSVRPKRRDALIIQAPVGRLGAVEPHGRAILRLGAIPEADISDAAAVWAATPAVADELVAEGVDADRVDVLPPVISGVPVGLGGQGLLAVLPTHDLLCSRKLLAALAQLDPSVRIRILPTVATESVSRLVREVLPEATLLGPVTSERRFAALAGECDAVVCIDPRDPFDRSGLIAAAAGAAVVSRAGATAASVLGDELSFDGSEVPLQAALAMSTSRVSRAAAVTKVCGLDALRPRLQMLLERASGARGLALRSH